MGHFPRSAFSKSIAVIHEELQPAGERVGKKVGTGEEVGTGEKVGKLVGPCVGFFVGGISLQMAL